MRALLGKLASVLLASTKPSTLNPQSLSDITQSLRQIYRDLERPGPLAVNVTETLRFSFVTPPVDGVTTWRDYYPGDEPVLLPDSSKPTALFLPGLDGYGISAATTQFDDLSAAFNLWRLTVLPSDRSPLTTVLLTIVEFVEEKAAETDQPFILMGESCGGYLAAAVAERVRKRKLLNGLVLINPATSFSETPLDLLVPILGSLQSAENQGGDVSSPTPYGIFGSAFLSSVIPDFEQLQRLVETVTSLPALQSASPTQLNEIVQTLARNVVSIEERLPQSVVTHRVMNWLVTGTSMDKTRLGQVETQTLVVVGRQDRLLPSDQEASRLVDLMPNAEKLIVRNRGHFVLDDSVNLTEAILYSDIDPLGRKVIKKYDPILDWIRPSRSDIEFETERTIQSLIDAHSPVYFSTDLKGKRWKGLSKIPRPEAPLLFVGNHQFIGRDLALILRELSLERDILPRGLAHPIAVGQQPQNELGRTPGLVNDEGFNGFSGNFQKYGAVKVTPRNFYRLLQTNQDVLLFPGGAREAMSGRRDYALQWPEKVDFVRVAARFNAIIIPFSAIGMVDSAKTVLDYEDVWRVPFLRDLAKRASANVTAARFDEKDEDEIIGAPIALPSVPARNYFLFGKPVDTSNVDPKNRAQCTRVYQEVKASVKNGIDDLLQARKHDPFRDSLTRIPYEQVLRKSSPTFSTEILNR